MHCLIVNHFKEKTSEKSVNRMSLVVLDIECIESNIVKEGKILSEFLETKIINLDDYACPKVQFLIFKDEEFDWRCSKYPFCHAKTLHCAERKAFAYGTWTQCFFNKL